MRKGQKRDRQSPASRGRTVLIGIGLLAAAALSYWIWRTPRPGPSSPARETGTTTLATLPARPDEEVFATYAGSKSCRECHDRAFAAWEKSHHALAERAFDPGLDGYAFTPSRRFQHGSQTSEARVTEGRYEIVTMGPEGTSKPFPVERVIGVKPLRQFLIAAPGGRYQVTELATDPEQRDWFNVFGEEDRRAGEWGHWTGRGMTWNQMCAPCHNTRLRKNFTPASDTYATTMAEMGVGCEACHGPMNDHVTWQRDNPAAKIKDPTARRLPADKMLAACGTCHSRRADLTGDFAPGGEFLDHHSLTIPDETDLYYADGQVREEDYEFASFLGSRMFAAGVSCMDCHDPHSARTRSGDNELCLRCHRAPNPPARSIEPAAHSHHPAGSKGGQCVGCHMPQTVYMQRHARRDHGFTVPDPLLTKELGIPNACNRCHTDQSADWALAAVRKWYGARMERHTRERARWIALAREAGRGAETNLRRMLKEEKIGLWRATAASLLKPWAAEPGVTSALLEQVSDPDPLVRTMTARSLEALVTGPYPSVRPALERLLEDPLRSVRIEAAWALRATVQSPALADLTAYLDLNSDTPSGLLQRALYLMDRNDVDGAIQSLRRAISWDKGSAALRHALAVGLSMQGRNEEAVRELESACSLAPRDPELRYKLGLALNEVGKLAEAAAALSEAVKLEPGFARAWYNLGLAHSALGGEEVALESLKRAEELEPGSARSPYARATILIRLGRIDEARKSALRALEIQPDFAEAAALLQMLDTRNRRQE